MCLGKTRRVKGETYESDDGPPGAMPNYDAVSWHMDPKESFSDYQIVINYDDEDEN